MQPVYVSIQQQKTGERIRALLTKQGLSVGDVQTAMGFENPQAVYKWLSGKSLPSLDNLVILSRILHTHMEDILVLDGDVSLLYYSKENILIHYLLVGTMSYIFVGGSAYDENAD